MKRILLLSALLASSQSFAADLTDEEKQNKEEALKILNEITNQYMEDLTEVKTNMAETDRVIAALEEEIEGLNVSKEEVEIRKNIIKELYVDLKDTEDLFLLDTDSNGTIKQEVKDAALIVKLALNNNAKIVKVKLANGQHLPLIKYKIQKNDTLKNILLHTYPAGYKPTWNEVSSRIDTLVKINKSVIKMNYIYPGQVIYIPLFNNNPSENEVKENILNQKKKQLE